ncbi:MAG: LD-carboxypeptidase [Chitinophagales bacterium]|nr:LD-carboxypeptidase [Chitinophagales bacterium]MDW8427480.1 LD-carboxypeptidase [Chitinophagales bacterium]
MPEAKRRVPSPLGSGARVALVAPARAIDRHEVQMACSTLQDWGWEVLLGATIGAKHFQFAGDDQFRCRDLQQFLDREDVHAILFARGGYGTARIIDHLNWASLVKYPKWLCGYSDITVIHAHVFRHTPIATLHSVMAVDWAQAAPASMKSLHEALTGNALTYSVEGHELNRSGTAEGFVCGGNLSVLYSLLGSLSFPDTTGAILLLEDIDEHLYHIDRMMLALRRAGALDRLAALVVGHFVDMHNKDPQNPFGESAYEIIRRHTAAYDYPLCFGFPVGHRSDNLAVVMGWPARLEVSTQGVRWVQLLPSAL